MAHYPHEAKYQAKLPGKNTRVGQGTKISLSGWFWKHIIYIYICIAQSQRDILGTMSSWVFGWSTLGSIVLSHIETRWYSETFPFLVLWPDRCESFSSNWQQSNHKKNSGDFVLFLQITQQRPLFFFGSPKQHDPFLNGYLKTPRGTQACMKMLAADLAQLKHKAKVEGWRARWHRDDESGWRGSQIRIKIPLKTNNIP